MPVPSSFTAPNGKRAIEFFTGASVLVELLWLVSGDWEAADVNTRAWVHRFTAVADDGQRYALVAGTGSSNDPQFMVAPLVAARLVRDGLLGQKKKSSFPWGLIAVVVVGLAYLDRNRR